ncbi:heptaprenyl diphosphate synthase component I [Halalkalibacter wakoensis JCM 9140]|uniref:Heptaprenyl diphosphate synthase component I n=1 Tax=Halalkalibacter wakoensis JCM 9140 TaxID=1236970 RepID=W4Q047_9BACI|nr:heptaprenyl diphosphate synthase component 1 [Halalkalibacter wakoensis]GAE25088.1 heptaprenyl diphosphate synthase component I [Halalkalibacter wakoensis JCM 9140]
MVSKSQFNDKVKEIKRSFYSLTEHLYLQSYVPEPKIDDDKVRFLYAMLNKRLSNSEAKLITISALLLQAALDMHDEVSLHPVTSDKLRKNRQLTVLAGDYYVGLYYYLLAEKNHVPMIRVFSQSIQEINESKMSLYHTDHEGELLYQDVQQISSQIESALMQNMADYFEQSAWKGVIKDFFYLKKLLQAKSQWLDGQSNSIIQSIIQNKLPDEDKLQSIDRRVEDMKDQLLSKSKNLHAFQNFVIEHVDELLGNSSYHEIAAEEG